MHLLFLSQTFPDADHPAQGSYNVALCRALAAEHSVTAIAPRSWPNVLRSALNGRRFAPSPAAAAAGIDCRYPTFRYTPGFRHAHHGNSLWRSVERTVRSIHAERPIDAVLSYWAHPDGAAGLRAAQLAGVPHAVIVGGSDVLLLPHQPDRREAVLHVLRNSDAVITVSEGLRQAVIALGIEADRVRTIYQGIDADRYHPGNRLSARRRLGLPENRALLLWVGRMVEVKRLDILIAACAELQSSGVDFELNLAGEGPDRSASERLVRESDLTSRVHFIGSVRHEELPEWYRAADVTVLSSRSEGLPNVLRESLACGTPFASTDVGSIREIADPMWSRLAPPGDAPQLARAIHDVLTPSHRAAAARYRARTWNACANDVSRLFHQLQEARLKPGDRGHCCEHPLPNRESSTQRGEDRNTANAGNLRALCALLFKNLRNEDLTRFTEGHKGHEVILDPVVPAMFPALGRGSCRAGAPGKSSVHRDSAGTSTSRDSDFETLEPSVANEPSGHQQQLVTTGAGEKGELHGD